MGSHDTIDAKETLSDSERLARVEARMERMEYYEKNIRNGVLMAVVFAGIAMSVSFSTRRKKEYIVIDTFPKT